MAVFFDLKTDAEGHRDWLLKQARRYGIEGRFIDPGLAADAMGHETANVLFTNYRAVVTKKDALEFWAISPKKPKAASVKK